MFLTAIAYSAAASLLAMAAYFGPRLLIRDLGGAESHTLATSIVVRLGTLHALILALIFAQEIGNHSEVEKLVNREAGAVADVYYGARRYAEEDPAVEADIPPLVARYLQMVIDEEWQLLAETGLCDSAWAAYTAVEMALLRLAPASDYERELRRQMLEDWDKVSELRRSREAAAARDIPMFFWVLAVVGFITVVIPYAVFKPRLINVLMISIFGALNGLVFYFILELSNPFGGKMPIEPVALERLYDDDMQQLIASALPGPD